MKIADMHCDTLWALKKRRKNHLPHGLRSQDTQIDLEKMRQSGYVLQNFAVFVDLADTNDPLAEALSMIRLYEREMAQNADLIAPALSWQDILSHMEREKISAVLTLEEGAICNGNPSVLAELYRCGARMMTLTWNYENELGFPAVNQKKSVSKNPPSFAPGPGGGLKDTGIFFLEEMERLGMIIDVSHLSDAGFYDVLTHTKKPFVASHSNARSVCGSARNLTDDMIRSLADRGGVIGVNFCRDFLGSPLSKENYLHQAIRQMQHLMRIGGEDVVGLGSDFDGITAYDDFRDCRVVPDLKDYMEAAGFTFTQIEKIYYKNILRIYRECL